MTPTKDIVVIYHKRCPDGFGAAYAAWKKFGDAADYIPAGYGDEVPEGLAGKEVYIVDFCYEQPGAMEKLAEETKHLIVLDHHESSKELVESAPDHVYDENRSGASIAWQYFHPTVPLPRLMMYLEDGDLNRYVLPESQDVAAYLVIQPDDFKVWDQILRALEDDESRAVLFSKAAAYREYFELLANISVEAAKKVSFEGYSCYFTTAMPSITMRSHVGHLLYTKLPPLALVVSAHPDGFGVSIRSDGSVDVSVIAQKYGGGGHPGAAGFFIPLGTPVPWVEIKD
jgi:hypothetical protein